VWCNRNTTAPVLEAARINFILGTHVTVQNERGTKSFGLGGKSEVVGKVFFLDPDLVPPVLSLDNVG